MCFVKGDYIMKCEKIFNKACEEKVNGCKEKAYELFSEVVFEYPGTEYAMIANIEMMHLSVNNAKDVLLNVA